MVGKLEELRVEFNVNGFGIFDAAVLACLADVIQPGLELSQILFVFDVLVMHVQKVAGVFRC